MLPSYAADSDMLAVLTKAFEEAWTEAQTILGSSPTDPYLVRSLLAKRIMAAAGKGERDPERLKLIALGAPTEEIGVVKVPHYRRAG